MGDAAVYAGGAAVYAGGGSLNGFPLRFPDCCQLLVFDRPSMRTWPPGWRDLVSLRMLVWQCSIETTLPLRHPAQDILHVVGSLRAQECRGDCYRSHFCSPKSKHQ